MIDESMVEINFTCTLTDCIDHDWNIYSCKRVINKKMIKKRVI